MFNKTERTQSGDRKLIIYLAILILGGLVILTSASSPLGYTKFHDNYFFIKKQILFGLLPGLVLFFILSKLPYLLWKKIGWGLYGFSLILLCLVFVEGLGVVLNGSRSWLVLGGFSFQPAELAKLSVIVVLSGLVNDQRKNWDNWQASLLPTLAIIFPAFLLIVLQPDIGTLSILVAIVFVTLYLAKIPTQYLIVLGLLSIIFFILLIWVAPYRLNRLTTFLHPELDPQGIGYQINQAFLAVGSGGFFGLGLGHSRQKFQYLPEVHADSIFAVLAEEMGFLISVALVILILLIGWRGLKIAAFAPDNYGKFIVSGIMVWLVWQSFLNIGAMVGALPLTGVPLPLISHGGSAYITIMAALGIVTNVSKHVKEIL